MEQKGDETRRKVKDLGKKIDGTCERSVGLLTNMTSKVDVVEHVLREQVPGKSIDHPATSCGYLKTHKYLRNGYFYIGKDATTSNLQFCVMEDIPIPTTTTAIPTTAITPIHHR